MAKFRSKLIGWKVSMGLSLFDEPLECTIRGILEEQDFWLYACELENKSIIYLNPDEIAWVIKKQKANYQKHPLMQVVKNKHLRLVK